MYFESPSGERRNSGCIEVNPGDAVILHQWSSEAWWPVTRCFDGAYGWVPAMCLRPEMASAGSLACGGAGAPALLPDNMVELYQNLSAGVLGMDTVDYIAAMMTIQVRQLRTSFLTIFRAFLSSAPPRTRCVLCSTWCPC